MFKEAAGLVLCVVESKEHYKPPFKMNTIDCSPKVFKGVLSFLLQEMQMELKSSFGQALRLIRKKKAKTQEDFSVISSRTYLSALERGLKSPTIDKIDELAQVIGVHPLTLLVAAYLARDSVKRKDLINHINQELEDLEL